MHRILHESAQGSKEGWPELLLGRGASQLNLCREVMLLRAIFVSELEVGTGFKFSQISNFTCKSSRQTPHVKISFIAPHVSLLTK